MRTLITGCSTGFGYLTAIEATRSGYEVIATMRDIRDAGRLTAAVGHLDGTLRVEPLDVRDPDAIARLVEAVGPVDALVNNAGICISGALCDLDHDEFMLMLETNVVGPSDLIRAVVPGMVASGEGRIVNVSSVAGVVGLPGLSGYAASKHALEGLIEGLRPELRLHNIHLSVVEPGLHATDMLTRNRFESRRAANRESPFADGYAQRRDLVMRHIAPRAGDPQRVARKIVGILGEERPRERYRIGWDARVLTGMSRLGVLPHALDVLDRSP
jgi:NAD(P)-dependent dehydrogenase (short-subunit alcohol dehydrogenase family)